MFIRNIIIVNIIIMININILLIRDDRLLIR